MFNLLVAKEREVALHGALAIFNGNVEPDKFTEDVGGPDQTPRTRRMPERIAQQTRPRLLVCLLRQGLARAGLIQHVWHDVVVLQRCRSLVAAERRGYLPHTPEQEPQPGADHTG